MLCDWDGTEASAALGRNYLLLVWGGGRVRVLLYVFCKNILYAPAEEELRIGMEEQY